MFIVIHGNIYLDYSKNRRLLNCKVMRVCLLTKIDFCYVLNLISKCTNTLISISGVSHFMNDIP